MKITIFGSGYVGLVTGACFAEVGNRVLCMDIDEARIKALNAGEVPIFEPGLALMIERNQAAGRLEFTADAKRAVKFGLFQLICVGTPPGKDGSADLQHVLAVAQTIGEHIGDYRVVINKSTVPVGTADKVREKIDSVLHKRKADIDFDVVANPEFLKEGAAIGDFMKPDRIVLGTDSVHAAEQIKALYEPFNRNHDKLLIMDVRSAELTKYAANAMLATKISFMNELANLADRLGADIEKVRIGIGSDPRIGYHFIYPGSGYGGSCFPKDVRALAHSAKEAGYQPDLLDSVQAVNERQKKVLPDKIKAHFGRRLKGKTIAVWGLAFKPNTDDMREAPSRVLIESLWKAGAKVRAYDPEAMDKARQFYGKRDDLVLCESSGDAVRGADALAIVTEWLEFRSPDLDLLKQELSSPVIFDGRNLYDPEHLKQEGFIYYGIGRGS